MRACELPAHLAETSAALATRLPGVHEQLPSLWQTFRDRMTDPRKPKGKRHQLRRS